MMIDGRNVVVEGVSRGWGVGGADDCVNNRGS